MFNLVMTINFIAFMCIRISDLIMNVIDRKDFISFVQVYWFSLILPNDLLMIAILAFVFSLSEVYLTLMNLELTSEPELPSRAGTLKRTMTMTQLAVPHQIAENF